MGMTYTERRTPCDINFDAWGKPINTVVATTICNGCGAIVDDKDKHTEFHNNVADAFDLVKETLARLGAK